MSRRSATLGSLAALLLGVLALSPALAGLELVGADVVEVSPPYDGPGQVTSLLAANLLFELVCLLALAR